jgi:hypothetical protein
MKKYKINYKSQISNNKSQISNNKSQISNNKLPTQLDPEYDVLKACRVVEATVEKAKTYGKKNFYCKKTVKNKSKQRTINQ